MRRNCFYLFILFALLASQSCNPKATPPNVILIMTDDLGYGDLGCYGATKVKTPNIDRLASQGRMFTDAHASSAVCSPSRYGLLTGQYPLRKNFWGPLRFDHPLTIDTCQLTISKVLKNAGYHTACIGKWHMGFGVDRNTDYNKTLLPGPLELGFDYYFGIPQVNSGPPFIYVENHSVVGYDPEDPFVRGQKSVTQEWPAKGGYSQIGGAKAAHLLYQDEKIGTKLKDKAIEWIKEIQVSDSGNPFFLYLATTNIHHPFTPAQQFNGTSECGRYGDFIHELDWIVGEVLNAVDEIGETNNTLVIFTSDNGGMLNHGGQDAWKSGHRLNGELLGFKFGAWEGGHRVPMIAKWPGKIKANTKSGQLISHVDLLSTFATIVGETIDTKVIHDSYNQLPSLTGNPETMIRDHLIISPNSPEHLVVRKGEWVYIPAQNEGGFQGKKAGDHLFGGAAVLPFSGHVNSDIVDGKVKEDAPPAQLYNLSEDLAQTTNLYNEYPEVVVELDSLLQHYREQIESGEKLGWINKR